MIRCLEQAEEAAEEAARLAKEAAERAVRDARLARLEQEFMNMKAELARTAVEHADAARAKEDMERALNRRNIAEHIEKGDAAVSRQE
jgi:hypothetical protein